MNSVPIGFNLFLIGHLKYIIKYIILIFNFEGKFCNFENFLLIKNFVTAPLWD